MHTTEKGKRTFSSVFVRIPIVFIFSSDSFRFYCMYVFFQHAIVTIILDNVVLIKNFICSRVENQVEYVSIASIIQSDDIVVIAKKHFIVIQICRWHIQKFAKVIIQTHELSNRSEEEQKRADSCMNNPLIIFASGSSFSGFCLRVHVCPSLN